MHHITSCTIIRHIPEGFDIFLQSYFHSSSLLFYWQYSGNILDELIIKMLYILKVEYFSPAHKCSDEWTDLEIILSEVNQIKKEITQVIFSTLIVNLNFWVSMLKLEYL